MSTVTIRVNPKSRDRIKRWASERRASVADVVDSMVDRHRREDFLHGLNDDFRRLSSKNSSRKDRDDEMKPWNSTLRDGLEEDGF